jgi:hypothetical protein
VSAAREERRDVGILLVVVGAAFLVGAVYVKMYSVEYSLKPLIDWSTTLHPYEGYMGPLLFLALICLVAGFIFYRT